MWKPLLALGCAVAFTACTTNTDTDPLAKIGRGKNELTVYCAPQVGTRLIRRDRCLKNATRTYDGTSEFAWWMDPAVSFGH